jgi:hypothetical protein
VELLDPFTDHCSSLIEAACEDVDWIHLPQDSPVASSCEHGSEPSGLIKREGFQDQLSDYRLKKSVIKQI